MGIKCSEILRLPSLKDLKVVGGFGGFEKIIRWVYVAECFEGIEDIASWLSGGELVVLTGHGIKGNIEALRELVKKLAYKNIAGIIINIGPYIKNIPQEIVKLADDLKLPLFELPWEAKLVEITREIGGAIIMKELEDNTLGNLLENILFNNIRLEDDLRETIMRYGFDLNGENTVGIIEIDDTAIFKSKYEVNGKDMSEIKYCLLKATLGAFAKLGNKILAMSRNSAVIFLIFNNKFTEQTLKNILDEVRAEVNYLFSMVKISAGISENCSNINGLQNSYRQAELALKAAKLENISGATFFYGKLGIYSLLLSIDDKQVMKKFYFDTFNPIINYDKINGSSLLTTLEAFIENSCNIIETSKSLYIHKNTLKYRIQKITDLLECNLKSMDFLGKYYIGLKIGRFLRNEQ